MSSPPSGVLRSPSARGTSRNTLQWDEENLKLNGAHSLAHSPHSLAHSLTHSLARSLARSLAAEEIKREGNYQKIEEASTPYMPPLDLSTIPDEDDDDEEGAARGAGPAEDARRGPAQMSGDDFQAAVAARLRDVADHHAGCDDAMDAETPDGRLPERSSDYKDGIPFASKRQKHYDMKNALQLGRQMLDEEEDEEDEEDGGGGRRIEREMEALEERG